MIAPELQRFVELFVRWNGRINLSAARTVEEVTLQVVDCLALVPYVEGPRVLDVGSGGGLPGLVLALSLPDIHVVSLEPVHKKAAFQSTAIRELGIRNAEVQARRVDPDVDTGFDTAISRATFDLREWLDRGRRLVRSGGVVLGMEGREQRELPADAERLPYAHGDRTRAVIRYRP
ncbi:MAG: 16S rRNA (guanine(527)-N(7))-methyltransferase RsmG [Kofleriaceae bacterium]|nr:MAG: 16S rRNA (guanine(527)-N(7))-methyltransferase RsmG [Kofleriaceae bacterium]MBZ0234055.1 16S rRNA (guanine(527)-N(7))-methyltransferase RsmG [Kofleriaceae bacterium]